MTTTADLLRSRDELGELIASRARSRGDRRNFRSYARDPVGFIRKVLGAQPWQKQVEIAEAVRDHPQVAVMSANGIGKDFVAAGIMLWWVFAREGLVLLTGPGERTILEALMRNEVARLFHRANLWGTLQTAALRFPDDPTADRKGVLAMTSSEIAKLGGHHAPRVLVVIEEAMGVESFAWHAMIGNAVGEDDRYLAIGNPDSPEGEFFTITRPGSGWRVVQVSALEAPNVVAGRTVVPGMITRAGVERLRAAAGSESGPLYISRVLGRFPEATLHALVTRAWLEAAVARHESGALRQQANAAPWHAGVDVARFGGDRSAIALRRGPVVNAIETWSHVALTETTGCVIEFLRARQLGPTADPSSIFASSEPDVGPGVYDARLYIRVDTIGLGSGVLDRLRELGWPAGGHNASARARNPERFANRRAEIYWMVRTLFEKGRIALARDEDLFSELLNTQYEIDSKGRIKIEGKDELRARIGRSPDKADALAMAFSTADRTSGGGVTVDF